MAKSYTDQERFEFVRRFKESGMSQLSFVHYMPLIVAHFGIG